MENPCLHLNIACKCKVFADKNLVSIGILEWELVVTCSKAHSKKSAKKSELMG